MRGNNIDGTPAPIRVLPEVVDAVGDQIEVVMDSGIRRGSDVVKALAFGAKAVMIGRGYLWGLAANGQAGVENVLDVLRMGIDSNLLGLGKASIGDLSPDDLVIPDGFSPPPSTDHGHVPTGASAPPVSSSSPGSAGRTNEHCETDRRCDWVRRRGTRSMRPRG